MSIENPPTENPEDFNNGLDFNPIFFNNESVFSVDLIRKNAITYPTPQDVPITYPNKIIANEFVSSYISAPRVNSNVDFYGNITTGTVNIATGLNLGKSINICNNNAKINLYGTVNLTKAVGGTEPTNNTNISLYQDIDTGIITIGSNTENCSVSIPKLSAGTDSVAVTQTAGDHTTKIATTSFVSSAVTTGTNAVYTALTESSNIFIAKQTFSNGIDINGTTNISTIGQFPTVTAPVSYINGGEDYSVLNKLGGSWDSEYLFNIEYITNVNNVVYAASGAFPAGLYLASVYFTIPPNTTFRLRVLTNSIQQTAGTDLTGATNEHPALIRRLIGNATVTETSMSGHMLITDGANYLSVFSQISGSGTYYRTLRIILTRIG